MLAQREPAGSRTLPPSRPPPCFPPVSQGPALALRSFVGVASLRRPKAGPRAGRPGIGRPGRGRGLGQGKSAPGRLPPQLRARTAETGVPTFSLVLSTVPGRAASDLLTLSAQYEPLLSSLPFPRGSARPQRRCASSRTCAPSPSTPPRAAPLPTTVWGLRAAGSSRSPWWEPAAWARPVSPSVDPLGCGTGRGDGTWETLPPGMETGEVGVAAESSAPSCPCFNLRGPLGVTLARRLSG